MDVHIRWLIRRDMAEVLKIEADSFEFPWLEKDFTKTLQNRNCIGMVCEKHNGVEGVVIGFMIYELNKTKLHVLNFAVDFDYRRQGIGTKMVDKLIGKLTPERRSAISLEVRETNLYAQLFFKRQGFKAVNVLKNYYDDSAEDAYVMKYKLPKKAEVLSEIN